MYYFVMDSRNQLGHPTRRVDYIRKELTRGRARIIRNYSNVKLVQLLHKTFNPSETVNAKIILGLDPGYKHVGFAILKIFRGKYSILVRGVAELRTERIKKLLEERKMYRQARRRHRRMKVKRKLGYRKFRHPRWKNRAKHALQPTHKHLIQSHLLLVRKLKRLINIDQINIEYFKYDSQKALNPNISGVQYQQGRMKGFEHVKAYVRHRDDYTCQSCGVTDMMLHVHHIVWRRNGGGNRPDNLVAVCVDCHKKIHNGSILSPSPSSGNTKMRDSGVLNTCMLYIYHGIIRDNPTSQVVKTFGCETKMLRKKYNVPKTHDMDAICIALRDVNPDACKYADTSGRDFIQFKQFRRHMRSWTSRIEDRKYYIYKNPASRRKTTLAWNRRKKSGQKKDSLQELRQKDLKIQVFVDLGKRVPKLSVKNIRDPKRTDRVIFRTGNQMLVNNRIETIHHIEKRHQQVFFEGGYYYTFTQLRNIGTHFRCNTGLVTL